MNIKQKIVFILVWIIAFVALILSLVLNKQVKELQDEQKVCMHWVRKIALGNPDPHYERLDKMMALTDCSDHTVSSAMWNLCHTVK